MPESLHGFQNRFASYLRTADSQHLTAEYLPERAAIYQSLLLNNITEFVDRCFPVCQSLLSVAAWQQLGRAFFKDWYCQTPYFVEIPQEFLNYLVEAELPVELPGWFAELAHYEWMELHVDTLDVSFTATRKVLTDTGLIAVNPSLQNLTYQWPVHRIGVDFQPAEPEPSYLAVYRNIQNEVQFSELNQATALLINLLQTQPLNRQQLIAELLQLFQKPNDQQMTVFIEEIIDHLLFKEMLIQAPHN